MNKKKNTKKHQKNINWTKAIGRFRMISDANQVEIQNKTNF